MPGGRRQSSRCPASNYDPRQGDFAVAGSAAFRRWATASPGITAKAGLDSFGRPGATFHRLSPGDGRPTRDVRARAELDWHRWLRAELRGTARARRWRQISSTTWAPAGARLMAATSRGALRFRRRASARRSSRDGASTASTPTTVKQGGDLFRGTRWCSSSRSRHAEAPGGSPERARAGALFARPLRGLSLAAPALELHRLFDEPRGRFDRSS